MHGNAFITPEILQFLYFDVGSLDYHVNTLKVISTFIGHIPGHNLAAGEVCQ
jgi:hypothetical protein